MQSYVSVNISIAGMLVTPHATAATKANQPKRETRNSESDRKKRC